RLAGGGGLAEDELRREHDLLPRPGVVELTEKEPRRDATLLTDRLMDGAEGRVARGRERDVVEPDDREVLRNAKPVAPRRAHRAEGHDVAHGQERARPPAPAQDLLERFVPAVEAHRCANDRVLRQRAVRRGHGEEPDGALVGYLADALEERRKEWIGEHGRHGLRKQDAEYADAT